VIDCGRGGEREHLGIGAGEDLKRGKKKKGLQRNGEKLGRMTSQGKRSRKNANSRGGAKKKKGAKVGPKIVKTGTQRWRSTYREG